VTIPVRRGSNGDDGDGPLFQWPIQAKLAIGARNDPLERQADESADRVLRAAQGNRPEQNTIQRKCAACEDEERKQLSRKESGFSAAWGTTVAPPVVREALNSPGQPLDRQTRGFLERGFGFDFGHVRVHTGAKAAESAAAVNALAYTVGSDVVFGEGQYDTASERGKRLLAHEISHVVQQGSGVENPGLQRFETSETPKIAPTFADMLTQIKKLIQAATKNGVFNFDYFVEISGGQSAGREIDKKLGSKDATIPSQLLMRYLFTCRCGLLDMRHFLQLLYISHYLGYLGQSETRGNRAATEKGREHELTAPDSNSRFAAEDTPSNALGAATNLYLGALPDGDNVFDGIKDTLTRCSPVDWTSLSPASKDLIVHFYGDRIPDPTPKKPGDVIPKNQNQTAVPDILPVAECGGKDRSLPFSVDDSDPDRKTIEGKNFLGGTTSLTSASDMRAYVYTQRPEVIKAMPLAEKIRFINKLLNWPVRSADKEAIEKIYHNSTADELRAEP